MKSSLVTAAIRPNRAPPRKVAIIEGPRPCSFPHRPTKLVIIPIIKGVISRLMPVMEPILIMRSGNMNEIIAPAMKPDMIRKKIRKKIITGRSSEVLAAASVTDWTVSPAAVRVRLIIHVIAYSMP